MIFKKLDKIIRYTLQLVVIYSFLSTSGTAQILNTKQISVSEGLSNSQVNSIKQDDYGFMWIGTSDGLNRYDGYEFKIFKNIPGDSTSIVGNDITDLAIDKLGNVWVATTLGASFYDRSKNMFTQYDFSGMIRNYTTSIPQCLEVFIDDSGNVLVGSVGPGLLSYDEESDSFNRIPYSDSNAVGNQVFDLVSGIAKYKGDLFTLSWSEGLAKLNRKTGQLEKLDYIPDNPKIVLDNNLDRGRRLYADANGQLWIVTQHGIYKYNPLDKKLKTIKRYEVDNIPDLNNLSNGISVDKEGNIWIAKDTRGIFKFDGISNDYEEIKFWESSDITGQTNLYVNDLHFDNTGILWIATNIVGINIYDPSREPFSHYYFDPVNSKSISGNEIFSLYESKFNPGKIFVGTRGAGLNVFDPISKTFTREKINLKNDMFGGSVRAILENDDGSLYLGSWGAGLLKYKNGNYSVVAEYDVKKENSLSENRVRVLARDADGKIWIGTNGGLNIFDPSNNNIERIYDKKIRVYKNELADFIRSNTKKSFKSILKVGDDENRELSFKIERPRDYLVINLGEEGISTEAGDDLADYGWITDNTKNTVWTSNNKKSYYAGGHDKNRVLIDIVKLTPGSYNLHYKSDDSHSYGKWNAPPPSDTLLWGIQLIELNENEADLAKNLIQQTENQLLIEATNIRSIHISGDIVWIGSDQQGLNKYNKVSKELKVYREDPKDPNSISNNSVQYIYEDNDGILWLATNGGLNRFDPKTEIFTVYNQSDGLASNYIASILEDDSGSLWISTRNGLSRMNLDKKNDRASFVNYDTEDGLGGSDYIALVALKSSIGNLYFGGVHGLNEFSPKKMNNQPPNIVLTDIKISNKSLTQMGEDKPIDVLIMDAKEMDLNYSQNDLAFDFAALHFSRSDKNQYAHFLEGFEKEWQYDNKRFAIYTNLDPGEYTFRVKGSNADGIWNYEGTSVKININPPWWFTTWAYIGYGLIFAFGIFAVDRIQRKRLLSKVKERRRIEEAELRAETAELQARASEAERKVLEAEFSQKKKELDEARDLQLSMLPKELPQLPHLDIAVYMQTATEVGGDYYDFHIGLDGTLTVVLGDATGHGMKAGTMVTTTKSLFNVLAPNPNIVETFHEMTRCLKLMHMEKLSMCMTMIKIIGNKIQMSAAGMPPVFIYKRENQSIEEHVMKGMPLGTFSDFPYRLVSSELSPGDTILLMSDGFPELFNDKKEMYGYKRARNLFEELATHTPEEIISKLKKSGSDWLDEKDPDDDVTFVVIKVK